jgi:uncharacterized cysteine cluster protein YcgN (CxxCxxCC family)
MALTFDTIMAAAREGLADQPEKLRAVQEAIKERVAKVPDESVPEELCTRCGKCCYSPTGEKCPYLAVEDNNSCSVYLIRDYFRPDYCIYAPELVAQARKGLRVLPEECGYREIV